MKGLWLEYKYRILESGIKYVIWVLLGLQLIIGFFGSGMIGAILSALLVIQINDTMIDEEACGWSQYCKILPVSISKQVGMRYFVGIAATGIMTVIFLVGRGLGIFNVEVPFYEVKQGIQWIITASFLCMSIQIPINLILHLKNIRNRLVGLPLVLVCYVAGRLIFYAIRKILDYFEQKPYVKNFGMVGLSYGGFYTLFAAAAETRIKAAVSCSFFNARDEFFVSDWTWQNAAAKFDDAEVACLVYPRNLCIEIGTRDELFDCKYGERSFEKLKSKCAKVGTDWVTFIEFDGTHEFCHDDAPLEKLAKILFEI